MQWKVPSTCGIEADWPLHFQDSLIGTKFVAYIRCMLKQPPSQKALYLHVSICITTTTSLAVSLLSWASACANVALGDLEIFSSSCVT